MMLFMAGMMLCFKAYPMAGIFLMLHAIFNMGGKT